MQNQPFYIFFIFIFLIMKKKILTLALASSFVVSVPTKAEWIKAQQKQAVSDILNMEKSTIVFDWKEYDFTEFNEKVIKPVEFLMWTQVDKELLMKLGLIENMWSVWDENKNIHWVLNHFNDGNYKRLHKNVSNKWANGLFQVLPATAKWLDKKYWIKRLIEKNRKVLQEKFWLFQQSDFSILENALYCAFYIVEIKNSYWVHNWQDIAGAYNFWPRYVSGNSRGKHNTETTAYIKKYVSISAVLREQQKRRTNNFQTF